MKEGLTHEQAAKQMLTDRQTGESNTKNTESNPQDTDVLVSLQHFLLIISRFFRSLEIESLDYTPVGEQIRMMPFLNFS